MSNLGQVINDNKDSIVALLRSRKTRDKVHLNVIPLPLRNLEWLKQPCWLLVLCLHSLATSHWETKRATFVFIRVQQNVCLRSSCILVLPGWIESFESWASFMM